ncbi:hypothetical protein GLAREA_05678 [Glarea lozoyensis ATCC 20868]|uniref:Uncharacterized protein n=1 Tax=Glarea lozoyensis (strain ATCC 20868 / MF5171) TaxID=1116229 RepID=S3DF27_GLAL2|nr:uncharacterized protein GLAREA_05678 [Glarea lozoyensis ATCC 20868]EPE36340.1 hypothetical protein GLAREA_05678 [Glarea lozoyensis ATCC 20868]
MRNSTWFSTQGWGSYLTPSIVASRNAFASASSMGVLAQHAPFPNSSYPLKFLGPAYKCGNVSESEEVRFNAVIWNEHHGFPAVGARVYYGINPGRIITSDNPVLKDFNLQELGSGFNYISINKLSAAKNISYQMYNATYNVQFQFNNGIQSTIIHSVDSMNTYSYRGYPDDMDHDRSKSTYAAYADIFSSLISGKMYEGASQLNVPTGLNFGSTAIYMCPEVYNAIPDGYRQRETESSSSCRNGTVERAIEDLSWNITLSMFTVPELTLMYHIIDFSRTNTTVPVTALFLEARYKYNPRNLLVTYGVATAITIAYVLIGFHAFTVNGIASDSSFSSILMTTRNEDLDTLIRGHGLVAQPLPDEIADVKLMFGVIGGRGSEGGHVAVGLANTVSELKKGEQYY